MTGAGIDGEYQMSRGNFHESSRINNEFLHRHLGGWA